MHAVAVWEAEGSETSACQQNPDPHSRSSTWSCRVWVSRLSVRITRTLTGCEICLRTRSVRACLGLGPLTGAGCCSEGWGRKMESRPVYLRGVGRKMGRKGGGVHGYSRAAVAARRPEQQHGRRHCATQSSSSAAGTALPRAAARPQAPRHPEQPHGRRHRALHTW